MKHIYQYIVQQWQNSSQAEFTNSVIYIFFFLLISIHTITIIIQDTAELKQNSVLLTELCTHSHHLLHPVNKILQGILLFSAELKQNSVLLTELCTHSHHHPSPTHHSSTLAPCKQKSASNSALPNRTETEFCSLYRTSCPLSPSSSPPKILLSQQNSVHFTEVCIIEYGYASA
jgi:hypothetical protein